MNGKMTTWQCIEGGERRSRKETGKLVRKNDFSKVQPFEPETGAEVFGYAKEWR